MLKKLFKIRAPIIQFPRFLFSSVNEKGAFSELVHQKNTKQTENRKLVENIFFPEYEQVRQKEALQKFLKSPSDPETNNLISDKEYFEIVHPINKKKEDILYSFIGGTELIELISKVFVNSKLLAIFMKYSNSFGRREIGSLLNKLVWTLENEDLAKKEEIRQFENRKNKLKKISPNVDMKFSAVFLSKEGVLQHPGWELLLRKTKNKIKNLKYTITDSILICKDIYNFTSKDFPRDLLEILKNVNIRKKFEK